MNNTPKNNKPYHVICHSCNTHEGFDVDIEKARIIAERHKKEYRKHFVIIGTEHE